MSQLDLNGKPEPPSPDERLWARLLRMHKEGYYEVRENAQALLDEGFFSEEWQAHVNLNAAIRAIEDACRSRNPDGTRRTVKTQKTRQYRLWAWATFDEALADLQSRLAGWRADGESIRIDAGEIIRRFPSKKRLVMAALPADLRPFQK
jgi:hypothetical protein